MPEEPIAILSPSRPRRILATAMMAGVGAMLIEAATGAQTVPAQALLAGFGVVCLVGAWAVYQATGGALLLMRAGLQDASGRVLASRANIVRIERSAFTLRPSNGFLLVLARPMPLAWAPGLWWRVGRYAGVGGITARADTRLMAETVAQWLEAPEPGPDGLPDRD